MDGSRRELLAGTALAEEQDVAIGGPGEGVGVAQGPGGLALADETERVGLAEGEGSEVDRGRRGQLLRPAADVEDGRVVELDDVALARDALGDLEPVDANRRAAERSKPNALAFGLHHQVDTRDA